MKLLVDLFKKTVYRFLVRTGFGESHQRPPVSLENNVTLIDRPSPQFRKMYGKIFEEIDSALVSKSSFDRNLPLSFLFIGPIDSSDRDHIDILNVHECYSNHFAPPGAQRSSNNGSSPISFMIAGTACNGHPCRIENLKSLTLILSPLPS
ncbi:hypothetical protein [Runella sp.]|uniref:hypothetical protein n=1 Tax=Runella sp. TaxID=1960881 RepID=UPI003D13039D